MLTVRLDDQGFSTRISELAGSLRRPSVLTGVLGRTAVSRFKKHFTNKDRNEPNQLGGPRTHFWRQVSDSVTKPEKSGDGTITFSITQDGYAQRLFGGEIHAKRGLYLTIPVVPEAHGRTAKTFVAETGLTLFFIRTGYGGDLAYRLPGPGANIRVAYVLKPSVFQEPDPTAMPDIEQLQEELTEKAEFVVNRELLRGNSNIE